jgi:Carboxypeptidase regulatory-like domain
MLKNVLVAVALLSVACHPSRPVIDPGPKPDVGGTISGTVSDGTMPLAGRKVTAVNLGTGARFDTSSTSTGGYTVRVPAGTYRLEFELLAGEALAAAPQATEVDRGDLDAGRDFILTVAVPR